VLAEWPSAYPSQVAQEVQEEGAIPNIGFLAPEKTFLFVQSNVDNSVIKNY